MEVNSKNLKTLARNLRKNQTDTEQILWSHLRNRQVADCKFRRQYPIGAYIVDFVCLSKNFIIELDGSQHLDAKNHDAARTKFLNDKGFKVIRFWNNDVLENTEAVLEKIYNVLMER